MLSRFRLIAALVLVAPYSLGFAQGVVDLIKTPPSPPSIDASKIPEGFTAVQLKTIGAESGASYMQGLLPFMMMSGGNSGRETEAMTMLDVFSASWTNGQVFKTEAGEFLLTYRPVSALAALGMREAPKKLTLQLTLVRKDTIVEITPRPDITRERMAELFSESSLSQASAAGKKSEALSNIKQVSLGMMMYMADYDDVMPYAQDTKSAFAVMYPYVKSVDVFKSVNPKGGRILLNMAVAGVSAAQMEAPAETVLFYDNTPWPDGTRLVSFMDGHAKFLGEVEWRRAEATLRLKMPRSARPLPPAYWKSIAPNLDFAP